MCPPAQQEVSVRTSWCHLNEREAHYNAVAPPAVCRLRRPIVCGPVWPTQADQLSYLTQAVRVTNRRRASNCVCVCVCAILFESTRLELRSMSNIHNNRSVRQTCCFLRLSAVTHIVRRSIGRTSEPNVERSSARCIRCRRSQPCVVAC